MARRLALAWLFGSITMSAEAVTATREVDAGTGLVIDQHWELVKAHCSGCHSTRLVTQNRGSRETWLKLIRWMQDTQGLWSLDDATEQGILDYLSRHYGPLNVGRRAPLPQTMRPPPVKETIPP